MKLVLIVAHALWLIVFSGAASAQSFDCARATKVQEKLICDDADLGLLDLRLMASLKRALAAKPEERESLLADERKWVQGRDLICSGTDNADKGKADKTVDCLKKSYENRIAVIDKIVASVPADKTLCHRVADLYRVLVDTGTKEADSERTRQILEDPFGALILASTPGVSVTKQAASLEEFSKTAITAWAKKENPPFEFPARILNIITENKNGGYTLHLKRFLNNNYYFSYVIQGKNKCYFSEYFVVKNGRAYRAAAPAGWDGDNANACAVDRSFGTIDGLPVALESDDGDFTAALGSRLTVTRWEKEYFAPACVVNFEFAPRFDIEDLSKVMDKNHCAGSDCSIKQQAALALAKRVQHSPRYARQIMLAQLTPQQKADFSSLPKRSKASINGIVIEDATDDDLSKSDEIIDRRPLVVPLVVSGNVCRASIGHETMGWRIWRQWTVTIECPDNGKLDEAAFTIKMNRGSFVSATVK